ncbi:MAG: hypothetical protein ACLUSP_00050 [Christensenellales bacterium]
MLAGDGGKILSVTDNADGYVKFTTLGAPNETTAGKRRTARIRRKASL